MKFLDRFRREQKESQASSLMVMTPGQAVWSPRNYEQFAKEAYGKNVVAYQSINKIAEAISSVRLMVFRGDQELTDHPLLALLRKPNPMQSGSEYIHAKVGFLMIAGNSYEERFVVGQEVRELYQLRPDRMKIIPAATGMPAAYEYTVGGKKARWEMDSRTLECDVRHLKFFNPTDDWYGLSPVEAGAYAIDQLNESMAWLQALLQNSARPSGALTVKDGGSLSDDNFNRLKAQIEDNYSGSRNAGRPMLLEGGLQWQQMGLSPTDMGIIEAKFSAARDVALAFGVPPLLLNIPGDNTYSNYAEARLAFWEDTVLPLLHMIVEDWNNWLGARYGVEIRADIDAIPAIAEKRQRLWTMADSSNDLTINERRAIKGYEPIAGGDVILVSSSQITLGMAVADISTPVAPDAGLTASDLKALAYGLEYKAEGYQPTVEMAREAERGLAWRKEYNRGGTEVGVARARDLSNRANLSADTVKRMVSYFARHEVDKQGEGFSPGEKGYPSAGRIAWALWGGDPGKSWANKIAKQIDADD
jgi:HK97 family phage portal protein